MTTRRRELLDGLAAELGGLVRRDHPLGALTTYRVGGTAALFVEAGSREDLDLVRRALAGRQVPVLVVGNGSNLLVADSGFAGLAIQLGKGLAEIAIPAPGDAAGAAAGSTVVRAGGGADLPVLARRTVEAGLTGLEWAVGVPGTVGGALRMNAGGHGADIASCLVRYGWIDLATTGPGPGGPSDAEQVDRPERLALGYRRSSLTAAQVVVWAELAVQRGTVGSGREALAEIVRWRRRYQPGGSNAGSVFVNPPGDSAGRLVEQAGLKGFRLGSARVSEKHANFIVADRGGSADDVRRLIEHVRDVVREVSGIDLRTEVHLVGFAGGENDGR